MYRLSLMLTVVAVALVATTANAGTLAVHLDAGQFAVTPANGADVEIWTDQASYWGNNHAVGVYSWDPGNNHPESDRPTYVANGLNGLPAIAFTGAQGLVMDNFQDGTRAGGLEPDITDDWNAGGQSFTTGSGVAVLRVADTVTHGRNLWDLGDHTLGHNGQIGWYHTSSPSVRDSFGSTNREVSDPYPNNTLVPGAIYITSVYTDGTSSTGYSKKSWLNGVLILTAEVTPAWTNAPTIGCKNTDQGSSGTYHMLSNSLDGEISEVTNLTPG